MEQTLYLLHLEQEQKNEAMISHHQGILELKTKELEKTVTELQLISKDNSAQTKQVESRLERERKEILTHTAGIWPGEFHIASELLVKKHNFQKLDSLSIKFEGRELYLIKAE